MTKEEKTIQNKEEEKVEKPQINVKKEEEQSEEKKTSEQELAELRDTYLRLRADFENYRKRKEEELVSAREKAIVRFVCDLLPSIDNFEMSLGMTENTKMFVRGVEMIHKNLIDTLKANHFSEYVPEIGEVFDPYRHDPVLIEAKGSEEAGKILGVLQKGFMHKDIVVRPARVQVAKIKEENEKNNKEENIVEEN